MTPKYLISVLTIALLFACGTKDNLSETLSDADIIALEGMNEAYSTALLYNDSLMACSAGTINCVASTVSHYDEQFHQFDKMYTLHHENYGHHNVCDDHHHEGNRNIQHGWMMHHNNDNDRCGHSLETYELMMELRRTHLNVHPR